MTCKAYKAIHGGWRCETKTDIGDSREMSIVTRKSDNGHLTTNVTVGKRDGNFVTHVVYQDFNQRVALTTPSRVTAKVVEEQHAKILDDLPALTEKVKAFYITLKEKQDAQDPVHHPV